MVKSLATSSTTKPDKEVGSSNTLKAKATTDKTSSGTTKTSSSSTLKSSSIVKENTQSA